MGRPQMIRELTYGLAALLIVFHMSPGATAQAAKPSAKAAAADNREIRLTGGISRDTTRPGQFNFLVNASGAGSRLTGKSGLRRSVGRRAEFAGGPPAN